MNVLYVLLGGGLGAVARYWALGWIQGAALFPAGFPAGTLVVNVVGCLLIGMIAQVADTMGMLTPAARALLVTGFLGGFTTYSTFGNEAWSLGSSGNGGVALLYVGLHLALGIGAVGLGRVLVAHVAG